VCTRAAAAPRLGLRCRPVLTAIDPSGVAGVATRASAYFAAAGTHGRAARPFPELADREVEVLQLIAGGLNNTDIARRLHLSDKTIRNNVSNIFTKLRVEDRAQAIVRARRAALGEPTTQAQP
jgi:DNA-binding NarL/FixJ family response regulator